MSGVVSIIRQIFLPEELLRHPEFVADSRLQILHVPLYLVVGDFGVNLRRGDMFVPQHLRYRFDGYALREADRRGERVPSPVRGGFERKSGAARYRPQRPVVRAAAWNGKDRPARQREAAVFLHELSGYG